MSLLRWRVGRRMRFFIMVFALVFSVPQSAQAISFDIWQTGLSRQEIISLAQRHNLPLARDGLIHSKKTYTSSLLSGEATRYYYQITLLDQPARVRLYLSPSKSGYGQFLYEIEVTFTAIAKNRDLLPYVQRMLEDKYGSARRENKIVLDHRIWRPESDSEVRLISGSGTLQIKYTDLKIKRFAEDLARPTHGLPEKAVNHRDSGKF